MRLLIERVQLHEADLHIIWRDDGWQRFCRKMKRSQFVAEQRAPVDEADANNATETIW